MPDWSVSARVVPEKAAHVTCRVTGRWSSDGHGTPPIVVTPVLLSNNAPSLLNARTRTRVRGFGDATAEARKGATPATAACGIALDEQTGVGIGDASAVG